MKINFKFIILLIFMIVCCYCINLKKIDGNEDILSEKVLSIEFSDVQNKDDNAKKPVIGNILTVHYTGFFPNGTEFDSSLKKNPFKFNIGQGEVISCWDQALLSFNIGMTATILCPYELAYGKKGSPPIIPEEQDLKFKIYLINID